MGSSEAWASTPPGLPAALAPVSDPLINNYQGSTGYAEDNKGRIWVSDAGDNSAQRYDATPPGGQPNWITVDLGASAAPYNYSDMTGLYSLNAGGQHGVVIATHDSECDGTEWGRVSWLAAGLTEACSIKAEVRAGHSGALCAGAAHGHAAGGRTPLCVQAVEGTSVLESVRYYLDGVQIASTLTSPYKADSPILSVGSHRFTAEARDIAGGLTREDIVFMAVGNLPPSGVITLPQGEMYPQGTSVPVAVTASDSDGSVQRVEIYVASHSTFSSPSLVATRTASPYTTALTGLAPGMYQVTAKIFDQQGAFTDASPAHFTVDKPIGSEELGHRWLTDGSLELDWTTHGAILNYSTDLQNWLPSPFGSPAVIPAGSKGYFRLHHCSCGPDCQCGPNCQCGN